MPMLHPCPRCTQVLPASAKFCRRCGTPAGAAAIQPELDERTKGGSLLTAGLSAMVICGAAIAGFVFWGASAVPTPAVPVQVAPVAQPPQVYYTPAPVYTLPVVEQPIPVVPAQPRFIFVNPNDRSGAAPQVEREHQDARGAAHEHGR